MNTRVMETKERHDKGFNCCQAVACTYCDLFGMDEATAFKACEAFGAGMGGMQGTCGAVSGAGFGSRLLGYSWARGLRGGWGGGARE